jgi:hypothetical protein
LRLSFVQKDILFILYAIELKGNVDPVRSMSILTTINDTRNSCVADRNFRVSCHTLRKNELIVEYRTRSRTLAWKLTPGGKDIASSIYEQRQVEILAQEQVN